MLNHPIMALLYSFAVALFLTTALVPLTIWLAPRLGLIDMPDARKMHTRIVPRCGGLAMALGMATPLLWFMPATATLAHLFSACLVIVIFGLLDDSFNLHYRWKFLGQIAAVIIAMRGGVIIQHIPLLDLDPAPAWLGYPLTFFFLLGVTNAVNLTDGLDGLAAGTTLLALAVIFAIAQQSGNDGAALIALTVIGGILGFLRFNTHPAQIFMGDTGSQLLGFIAACLSLLTTQSDTVAVSGALPLLILGLPVLDTLTVMTIRVSQRRSPFAPDRNHLHHQIMALGFRHNEAVAIIYLLQIALLAAAFFQRYSSDIFLLGSYLLFCAAVVGTLAFARRKRWHFRMENRPSITDRRNLFLRRFEWFYQHSALVVLALLAALLITPVVNALGVAGWQAPLYLVVPVLLLAAMAYARWPAWSLRLAIYATGAFSVYLSTVLPDAHHWLRYVNAGYFLLACLLGVAIRMTRREQFRLDTQDLLILAMILIVPLLPLDMLRTFPVAEFTLRLAVLMYSCEFIIGRTNARPWRQANGIALLIGCSSAALCTFPIDKFPIDKF